MFERLTDQARKVMALANQEAQRLNHEYIGTEHILLGLVKAGAGTGVRALRHFGVDLSQIKEAVEGLIKPGPDMATMGKLPQTPRAKTVVEGAVEEARQMGHGWLGTEHLLLGLIGDDEGVAVQVLREDFGLQPNLCRDYIASLLAGVSDPDVGAAIDSGKVDPPGLDSIRPLAVLIDPGSATSEEIGELFFEISTLYRMLGGSGITFTMADAKEPVTA